MLKIFGNSWVGLLFNCFFLPELNRSENNMNTFESLLHILRSIAWLNGNDHQEKAQEVLRGIKNYPSLLGNDLLLENQIPTDLWTPAQQDLFTLSELDKTSDMMDHIPTYDDEECAWVKTALTTISKMSSEDVRSEEKIKKELPNVIEYRCLSNCTWDPKKRDTVIQLKIKMTRKKATRLVEAPLCEIYSSLRPILRHKGKAFQSLHMTSLDLDCLRPFIHECDTFIMTVWVGSVDKKITESGTGFRSSTFPGQSVARDNSARILFRPFKDDALLEAHKDFEITYGQDRNSVNVVPVLMQLEHFIRL